jgi:hypothetical protein
MSGKTEAPRKQASWVPLFFVVKYDEVSTLEGSDVDASFKPN